MLFKLKCPESGTMFRSKAHIALLVYFGSYIIFVLFYDKYIFESVLLLQSWSGAYYVYNTDQSATNMFHLDRKLLKTSVEGQEKPKLMLIWKPFFGTVLRNPHACPGCVVTYDHSAVTEADLIFFHCVETRDSAYHLPFDKRTGKQMWVWLCQEPPWNVRYVFEKTLTPLNGVFNWTASYRTDSDIYISYSSFPRPINKTVTQMISRKNATALAAWAVSNCESTARTDLISELSKYISIDIYGKCSGRLLCRGPCQRSVLSRYKFYFALENSQCKDYITEKYWDKALESNTVPVVMGPSRREYEIVSPPHSFIHVDDFATYKQLAEYLMKLDNDDELYGEYLRWRSVTEMKYDWITNSSNVAALQAAGGHDAFVSSRQNHNVNGICAACEKLKRNESGKVVKKLDEWWFGAGYSRYRDDFPICSNSGPSGSPKKWLITLAYNSGFAVITFLAILCCRRKRRSKGKNSRTNQ